MELLKKENAWMVLLLTILTGGANMIVIAFLMGAYNKDAWYANWKYWVLGTVLLLFPALIMYMVFVLQMTCEVAYRLEVPGHEIYMAPYIWMLCMIVPFIGWALLFVMLIYVTIYAFVKLFKGKAEKYI